MRGERAWAALFVGPAALLAGFYLVLPTLQTVYLSFFDRNSQALVGLDNYRYMFTNAAVQTAFRNNLLWLVVFTAGTVLLGLVLAVLLDRVRYEAVAKSIIFLPMAISFAGAGVIWRFMYAYRPPGADQIGLLNQVVVALGGTPRAWLIEQPWINNLALIGAGIWIWTGFCLVIISAAYKGIPKDMLEAARVDGANELQVFRHISLPSLYPTLAVITTTMIINVMKIFDIVYVMTNGQFGTEVLANRMYKEMFQFRHFGRASAVAVVLLAVAAVVMVGNIRRFKREEEMR
ncbi:MAG TPA: sugar ABC transporter permease [Limnochordales bacterium]|nr:sugar ABC transporter permease [Limnochordales bacterium]